MAFSPDSITIARVSLQDHLQSLLGLKGFEAVQFSLLPEESPLGYIQLYETNSVFNSSGVEVVFLVDIGVSANSFSEVSQQTENLASLIVGNLTSNSEGCFSGAYKVALEGSILVEPYDSYVTTNHISDTTVWSSKLAFRVRMSLYKR